MNNLPNFIDASFEELFYSAVDKAMPLLGESGRQAARGTGRRPIQKANEKFYNIALIDIRLPDISGVELLAKIKETKPKMRKIIITGYPTLQNAVETLNKGADAYIIKPLDIEKTLAAIEEQLKKQREEQEMTEEQLVKYIETRAKQIEEKERQ